jgi:phage terminase large subunit-like protein
MTTTRNAKEELLRLLEEKRERETYNKAAYYYPDEDNTDNYISTKSLIHARHRYAKHLDFFAAGAKYRQRLFTAGNRVGKSFAGCIELYYHLSGKYPEWWVGRRFNRPIKAWVVGFNAKQMKDSVQELLLGKYGDFGSGLIPRDELVRTRPAPGVPGAIETFDVKHTNGGNSVVTFKSHESGQQGFSGAAVDVVMCDEEPPLAIYTECVMRTATTGGIIYVCFTPDRGYSDTVLAFFDGGNFREGPVGEKYVTTCGWADTPHLDLETQRELYKSIPPYLRDAKTKGIPYLGSGAIYPILSDEVFITPLKEIPREWPRAYALDVGWNRTAALWGAHDRENDIWYIYSEYYRGQAEPAVHAEALKSRGSWIPGIIDKAARGRSQVDGQRLFELYTDRLGLDLVPSYDSKVVESGIQNVLERLSSGRLFIFNTCVNTRSEYNIYRRDQKGKIIKQDDHLMDCLRYLMDGGAGIATTKPEDDWHSSESDSWFANSGKSAVGGY